MKKKTVNYLAVMLATAFLASGCNGLKQMAQNAHLIQGEITPNPLEMHAGKVPVNVTVTFPAKYFNKSAYVLVTPVLHSNLSQEEIKMKPATLQGSKVKDNNTIIDYKKGGTYVYKDTIDYSDPYRKSDFMLNIKGTKDLTNPTSDLVEVKIADGINVTPLLVEEGLKVDNGVIGTGTGAKGSAMAIECKIPKPTQSITTKDLTMFYKLQQGSLDSRELKKSDVKAFMEMLAAAAEDVNTQIKSIEVASYASPDGPEAMNQKLVDQRGKSGEKFTKDQLKKIEGAGDVISRQTTQAEDWEGFKKSIEASDIKDKDLILRVLSMYSDPTTREREIKNIAAAYTALKSNVLPQLRRSEIKATLQTKEKSDAELAELYKSNFDELTQDEALYASTMPSLDNAGKIDLLKKYTAKYPNDWRGFNNLGVAYIKDNKISDAEAQFNKAKAIDSKQSAIYNNLGVCDLANGDVQKAKENLSKANNIGSEEAGYNLGVINIRNGEYDKAVANFGSKPSFNKALAQILAKSPNDAERTLNDLNSQEALSYYLRAIVGSRNNDEEVTLNNLKTAIDKDSKLKSYAKFDVEFIRYFENPTFLKIVE